VATEIAHEPHPVFGPVVVIRSSEGSSATVALHGGHVISWIPSDGRERIFLSSTATANGAIRGGIPVCFPQFADRGPLPKHGFARTSTWRHKDGGRFVLDVAPHAWVGWPYACVLTVDVTLGPNVMSIVLSVDNVGPDAFEFTGALHTYLRVDDIELVSVDGSRAAIFFDGEVDLVVPALDRPLIVRSAGVARFICAQTGFIDGVVWNVGSVKAEALTDLGRGEWQGYVCVEAAMVDESISVQPGGRWVGSQTLIALDSNL
jgi:glucose-6-phosphate 1-epimerase